MKNTYLSRKDYDLFMLKSLLWLALAWGGFALALSGFFYASIVWIALGILGIWLRKKAVDLRVSLKMSRELLLASIFFLLVAGGFSVFSEPSVFTGRDQGSFSEAAARLAQNHQLEFSTPASQEFFKLHEKGRALNFPGFYYTEGGTLITQFSLVYISWLALFFAVFGAAGFIIANSLLLFTFFLGFYLLLRLFMTTSTAMLMTPLMVTSFVFMWFSKFTLSENIALPLVWTTILALMLFVKNQRRLYYFIFLASALLLCFTRIEGVAFLVAAIIVLAVNKDTRFFIKEKLNSRFVIPAIFLLMVAVIDLYVDRFFYKEIIKAILPSVTTPKAKYLGDIKNNFLPDFYIGKIFYLYGLLGFFIAGAIGLIVSLWKKDHYKLLPFFVILPTLIYFFDSQITPDHPWILRRFAFSLFPAALFYTGLLISELIEKSSQAEKSFKLKVLGFLILITLFTMNLPSFLKYVSFTENKGLFAETQAFSLKFSDNDLILIDQQATGDGWSMLGGPMNYLHGKNAVYFFNNQDLNKLDVSSFSNVYLVASDEKVPFYKNSTLGERLIEKDKYTLETKRLEVMRNNTLKGTLLPEKKSVTITGKIFLIKK